MTTASTKGSHPSSVGATFRQPMPVASVLCGRNDDLAALTGALVRLPVAVIYGVAGVGKTALAVTAALRWPGGCVYSRVVDSSLGVLLNDARRALNDGPVAELESDDRRLSEVVRLLEDTGSIWLIDDLHVLAGSASEQLLAEVGRGLSAGRVLATSRDRLVVRPGDPDRFETKLSPLGLEASIELWRILDELYGPVGGFEQAYGWARGNPFSLRRAHAGGAVTLNEADPVAATVQSLGGTELELARTLALSRISVPETVLSTIVGADRFKPAIRELFRRLIVEVDAAGGCSVHDLFRATLQAGMDPGVISSTHDKLARALLTAPMEPLARLREAAFHLCAAGQFEDAGAQLVQHLSTILDHGAASDLLHTLDAVRPASISPCLETVRAILLVRTGHCERGFGLLDALHATDSGPTPLLKLALAQAATMTGRLALADDLLTPMVEGLPDQHAHYHRVLRMLCAVRTCQGRIAEARALLDRAESVANTQARLRKIEELRVFTFWFEGRYLEAETHMRRARALLDRWPRPTGDLRLYITFAPLEALLGRFEDAEQTLRESSMGLSDSEELLPVGYRVERAVVLGERGDRVAAIALLREAIEDETARGFSLSVWWARLQLGRNLLAMGRRIEAEREFDAVDHECRRAGAVAVVAAIERERSLHPLRPEDHGEVSTVGTRIRRRCLCALRAAEYGDASQALSIAHEQRALVARAGYGLDRAILELTHATLARLRGSIESVRARYQRAVEEANHEHVDAALFDELLASMGSPLPVESPGPGGIVNESDPDGAAISLDTRKHLLRVGAAEIDLGPRPVVRQVLYALVRRSNHSLSKECLAQEVWGVVYHPLQHDNAIRVTIRRLRVLLEGSPLRIETTEEGYRLAATCQLVVDP